MYFSQKIKDDIIDRTMTKFYITTAIDYVNDTIHIGHAFQKIIADVLARYYRIKLGEKNVFFLTGTDEYGQKAEKAAKKVGILTKIFVDKISKSDQKQQDSLNISYNRFIRTTDPDHIKVVQEIWNRVNRKGDIYLDKYTGLYCDGCEAYYTKKDLINGKCPFHPNLKIKKTTEENYFFRWSKYKDFLIHHIKSNPDFILPKHRANEMLEFVKEIKDIPISRTNFKWGISVPNNPKQVVYVWFDALINYITGIGFLKDKNLFEKFWPADVHILGKDNLRWHSLLWPAMLKSAEIELPKTILVNGFLNLNGEKISKSLGNIIKPTDWVKKYGADAVRYYLLRYTTLTEDSNISEEKLIQAYNSDLANGLGNLVSRVTKLCEINNTDLSTAQTIKTQIIDSSILVKYEHYIENYTLNLALEEIWKDIKVLNTKINQEKVWSLSKENADQYIKYYVKQIKNIAIAIRPFLPKQAKV